MTWYKTGTVNATQGSNAIIGTGTAFISNSRVGDAFRGPDGEWYEVINIASDTAMSISPSYQGASTVSDDYSIAPMQGYVKDTADALRAASLVIGNSATDMSAQLEIGKGYAERSEAAATTATTSEGVVQTLAAQVSADTTTTTNNTVIAQNSATAATEIAGRFLLPKTSLPTVRDNGQPLEVGDRVLISTTGADYIYSADGWHVNGVTGITAVGQSILSSPTQADARNILEVGSQFTGSGLGYNAGYLNAITRTMQSRGKDAPCVFDYFTSAADIEDVRRGTKLNDHTSQVQAFINATKGFNNPQFRNGVFPAGDYNITQVVFTDHNDVGFTMNGSRFNWIGTTATNGALKFVNAINVAVRGNWVVNGYDSLLLENGVWVTTGPGDGVTVPVMGVTSLMLIDGMTGYRCKNAIKFGTYNEDPSCAEIILSNFRSQICPGGVHIAGSQTGVQIVGSVIVSAPGNFAPGAAEESAIKMEGGFATVSGSIVEHVASERGQLIHLSPCQSATYGNVYPTLQFGGATHIESAAYVALIDNPRGLPNPDSTQMCLDISSVQGYIGAVPATQALIMHDVDDGFSGVTKISGGNLYAGKTVRTAKNIAYTAQCPNARVEVDNSSFGNGCLPWLGGVLNGKVVHGPVPAVYADNLAAQSIPAGGASNLIWKTSRTDRNFARYGGNYSTATGLYTVPAGGASYIKLKVNTLLNTTGAGWVEVLKNGTRVSIRVIQATDLSIAVDFEDAAVAAGTTYGVKVVNTGGSPISFSTSGADTLIITMATE